MTVENIKNKRAAFSPVVDVVAPFFGPTPEQLLQDALAAIPSTQTGPAYTHAVQQAVSSVFQQIELASDRAAFLQQAEGLVQAAFTQRGPADIKFAAPSLVQHAYLQAEFALATSERGATEARVAEHMRAARSHVNDPVALTAFQYTYYISPADADFPARTPNGSSPTERILGTLPPAGQNPYTSADVRVNFQSEAFAAGEVVKDPLLPHFLYFDVNYHVNADGTFRAPPLSVSPFPVMIVDPDTDPVLKDFLDKFQQSSTVSRVNPRLSQLNPDEARKAFETYSPERQQGLVDAVYDYASRNFKRQSDVVSFYLYTKAQAQNNTYRLGDLIANGQGGVCLQQRSCL